MPEIGDYCCVPIRGNVGRLVRFGEWLNGNSFTQYQHAFVYVGAGKVVQAEPGGADAVDLSYYDSEPQLWSKLDLTPEQRSAIGHAAQGYILTPYSFLDYLALALHRLRIWFPGLRNYIKTTRHMICSQLVAQCYLDAGVDLFPGEWVGYVTPAMLAARVR